MRRIFFRLIVRDSDSVKHYRIRQSEDGRFFIARRTTFNTLQELVAHYSKLSDGLCVNLRRPCVHVRIESLCFFKSNHELFTNRLLNLNLMVYHMLLLINGRYPDVMLN